MANKMTQHFMFVFISLLALSISFASLSFEQRPVSGSGLFSYCVGFFDSQVSLNS